MDKVNLHTVECEGAEAVAIAADGKLIALARVGAGGAAIVKTSSEFVCELEGTDGAAVGCVAWSEDNRRVASGGAAPNSSGVVDEAAGFVVVNETEGGRRAWATRRPSRVLGVAFSPGDNGNRLAVSQFNGYVEVLDGCTGDALQRVRLRGFADLYDHRAPFAGVSPDRPVPPRPPTTPTPCVAVCWNHLGDKLVVARKALAALVDLNLAQTPAMDKVALTAQEAAMEDEAADDQHAVCREIALKCGSDARAVACTHGEGDVQYLAVCGGARVVLVRHNEFGLGTEVADKTLDDQNQPWRAALAVAFCRAGKASRLVVGGELKSGNGAVAIFDASNGAPLSAHRARAAVLSLSVSKDGATMAVGERKVEPKEAPAEAPAPAGEVPKLFTFGSQQNVTAPPAPEDPEQEGPNLLKLVMQQHRQSL
eukprot:CAMPEP_0119279344 /NCGR_PEP_ID=MMETSP1329-20130426/20629_1 /TAXON_ID=114041 /ORGANISM="Genus nov. species nov., Strain RCC1024" /LENGTH=423 /DNA_ID=CAMNT_0007279881 /DNA_START=155 /DNA_END=1422 /DNA_ORIENTATION=-